MRNVNCLCYVVVLSADEAEDSSRCEQCPITDCCASSVVKGTMHRPTTLQDKCCADELRNASTSSVESNDCTFQGIDHRSDSAGVCSALPSSASQVEVQYWDS